jgi:hypothetical protein
LVAALVRFQEFECLWDIAYRDRSCVIVFITAFFVLHGSAVSFETRKTFQTGHQCQSVTWRFRWRREN